MIFSNNIELRTKMAFHFFFCRLFYDLFTGQPDLHTNFSGLLNKLPDSINDFTQPISEYTRLPN